MTTSTAVEPQISNIAVTTSGVGKYGVHLRMVFTFFTRGDKVQDKSGFPDRALMHFGHEIIAIIAFIWF